MFFSLVRRFIWISVIFDFCTLCFLAAAADQAAPPVAAVRDQYTPVDPSAVRLKGLLGQYQDTIREHFVLYPDIVSKYLDPLEKHNDNFWKAEHIGKWLDAASSVWRYSGDPKIRELMDEAVRRMAAAQNTNGWLGSYEEPYRFYQVDWNIRPAFTNWDDKWHGWDLWCNFMSLEGLLKYHSVVKEDTLALRTAQRIGNLVCETFGDAKQDIAKVPHDNGIGAMTSMLGLMHLYECTGEPRYLDFARYVIRQFGRPGTMPIILSGTRGPEPERFPFASEGAVLKHAECELVWRGMCELYRMTGENTFLTSCEQIYDSGYGPLLETMCLSGYCEPKLAVLAPRAQRQAVETCDIIPTLRWWIEMFRLTGDARYLNAVERQMYNQLLSHLNLRGEGFMNMPRRHFSSPSGCVRRYGSLDPFDCCWSMGPVGIADLPAWTYFTSSNAILLNCYESSSFTGTVSDAKIRVEVKSEYPLDGHIDILVRAQKPTAFALDLRIPDWCEAPELNIGGEPWKSEGIVRGIMRLQRKWQGETHLLLNLPMRTRVTKPMESVPGYCMIERGPLVLAMTRRFNPNGDGWCYAAPIETNGAPLKLERISLAGDTEEPVVGWQTRAQTRVDRDGKVTFEEITITLVPFYQAGTQRDPYVAAFPTASTLENLPPRLRHQTRSSLGAFGAGARAVADGEATDQDGCANYAIDGDLATVWRSGTNGYPHWIEIKLPERKTISRVIIRFGDRNNHPVDFKLLAGKTEGASDEILAIKGCTIADYYWAKFDPVEVDSVRLILQKSSDEDASSAPIREIELYRN